MSASRRNVMWPLIIIAVGAIWLLMVVGALPEAIGDILKRAWPALLVLLGLDVLLGRRQVRVLRWRVEASLAALLVLIILLGGLVWLAYAKQADVVRADKIQVLAEALPDEITQLRIELAVEHTTVTIHAAEDARELRAEFSGSNESAVEMTWLPEGGVGVLTVSERRQNTIPKLADYGRGTLDLALPSAVQIASLELVTHQGNVTMDLQPLRVGALSVDVRRGDLEISLPALGARDSLSGILRAASGQITINVPEDVSLTLSLAQGSGEPVYRYDGFRYDLLRDGTLKLKNTDAYQVGLFVWLRDGAQLTIVDLE